MLLGVEVDDKLLVDALRNFLPSRDIQELSAQSLGVEIEPRILGYGSYAVLDNLKAL